MTAEKSSSSTMPSGMPSLSINSLAYCPLARSRRTDSEAGNARRTARQQHFLDAAGQREVEVELAFLDLEIEKLGVVQRERGLLGQRLHEGKIRRAERQAVGGIRHPEHAEKPVAKN